MSSSTNATMPYTSGGDDNNRVQHILIEIVGATNLSTLTTPSPTTSTIRGGSVINPLATINNVSKSLSALQNSSNTQRKPSTSIKVLLNQEKIHKTSTIKSNDNPIFTVSSGCLFMVPITSAIKTEQTKSNIDRLTFEIRDLNSLVSVTTNAKKPRNECLGTVRLDIRTILQKYCNEERIEFPVVKDVYQAAREGIISWDEGEEDEIDNAAESINVYEHSKQKVHNGDDDDIALLSLRFRRASDEDVNFMNNLQAGRLDLIAKDSVGVHQNSTGTNQSQQRNLSSIPSTLMMTEDDIQINGGVIGNVVNSVMFTLKPTQGKGHKLKLRTKPCPDPYRPNEVTRFLSEEELISAAYSSSKRWIECGSHHGEGGQVYVEILHCDNLPICDSSASKTNAFVSIVHEDAAVQTDVVASCLSPLWMPWTKRAFSFNRLSPLSPLYVGVFHYDAVNPSGHTGIGRIAINLQQLKPGHIYLLSYTLYTSPMYTNRKSSGTITLRIRIDPGNERGLLLAAMKPTKLQLNFKRKKSLAIVKYTCHGKQSDDKFDVALVKSMADEMMELMQTIQYAFSETLYAIIFWRHAGYSLAVYMFSSYVVERPYHLPSLLFWSIFFVMLASYNKRTTHPSPWQRPRSISDLLSVSVRGKSSSVMRIAAGVGAKEAVKFEQARQSRVELDADAATKRFEMEQQVSEVEDIAEPENTSASRVVPQIDPLAMLLPLQRKLEKVIYYPRLINSIITWENSTISFAITISSFTVALLFSVLPVAWLIQCVLRIIIHVGLGPHMKIVDAILNSRLDLSSDADRLREQQSMMKKLAMEFKKRGKLARIKAEDETKQAEMRKIRLGSCTIKVPPLNSRFPDYPNRESTATPVTSSDRLREFKNRTIVPGQHLYGKMIPVISRKKHELSNSSKKAQAVPEHEDDDAGSAEQFTDAQLAQLAEYNFKLAQAKADLDLSLHNSRKDEIDDIEISKRLNESEKEVERLSNIIEELSCKNGKLVETNVSNDNSLQLEEITLSSGLVMKEEDDEESDEDYDDDPFSTCRY